MHIKSIFEKINDCENNMVDILEMRKPVADYMEAAIQLFHNGIMTAENTDKVLSDVEEAFKLRKKNIETSLLKSN
jgi:hypothetical protein